MVRERRRPTISISVGPWLSVPLYRILNPLTKGVFPLRFAYRTEKVLSLMTFLRSKNLYKILLVQNSNPTPFKLNKKCFTLPLQIFIPVFYKTFVVEKLLLSRQKKTSQKLFCQATLLSSYPFLGGKGVTVALF